MHFSLELVFIAEYCLLKCAILLFYWNLVPRGSSRKFAFFHRSIAIVFAMTIMLLVAALIPAIFQCVPVAFWRNSALAKCFDLVKPWIVVNVLALVTDFIVLASSIKVVWRLPLAQREKIVVTTLFLMGGLSILAGIPRTVIVGKFLAEPDKTFLACGTTVWIQLEFNLAIIAVCVPTTRSLMMKFAPWLLVGKQQAEAVFRAVSPTSGRKTSTSSESDDGFEDLIVKPEKCHEV